MDGKENFNDDGPVIAPESETSASTTSPSPNAGSGTNDSPPEMTGISEADGQNPPQPGEEFNDRPL